MITLHYTGPAKPGLLPRIGWWLIKTGQKAPYGHCTHTEALHEVHPDGSVTMASSSIADGGVRRKRTRLVPGRWTVVDVPQWDVRKSINFFDAVIEAGLAYDARGAAATLLPGKQHSGRFFCTEAVLYPFVQAPHYYNPALGLSLCLSLGTDITETFFKELEHASR